VCCVRACAICALCDGSEHPAILFRVPTPGPAQRAGGPSSITGCSFDSYNYAVVSQNWAGLALADNVVARSVRTAFDVDATSTGIRIWGNMVRWSLSSLCFGAVVPLPSRRCAFSRIRSLVHPLSHGACEAVLFPHCGGWR
jgi:hypothetical protein